MSEEGQLQLELGRALAAEVVPEELPYFDELVTSNKAAVSRQKDNELGFGGEAALVGVASVFLYQISEVVLAFMKDQAEALIGDVAKGAAKDFRKEIERKLSIWIKDRFRGVPPINIPEKKRQALLNVISKDAKHAGIEDLEVKRLTTILSKALGAKS
jgi:hypothetical protein